MFEKVCSRDSVILGRSKDYGRVRRRGSGKEVVERAYSAHQGESGDNLAMQSGPKRALI